MEILFLTAGIAILILITLDILSTILHMGGGGIISNKISGGVWKLIFLISGRNPKSRLLNFAGPLILIKLFASWLLLIWLGFSLIYLSDGNSVVDTSTEVPASVIGTIYYVGYTLSSLGNGDLKAGSDFWRPISNLMSMYGTFFITLSISYLIPVLSAVIKKRSLSAYIYQMGSTPDKIIKNGWNGENFHMLYNQLHDLHTMILEHSERHLAYPVLHYFHSTQEKYSAPLTLAVLDEAITIQEVFRLDKSAKAFNWTILRRSLDAFLDVLSKEDPKKNQYTPKFPYRDKIRDIPFQATDDEISKKLEDLEERRKRIHQLIKKGGWEWKDITGEN